MSHPPYLLAAELDGRLGDPADPEQLFSSERCRVLEGRDEFPAELCDVLDEHGLSAYYVPEEHGGRLRDYEDVFQLLRTVARRDITVAVAHGTSYVEAVPVWIAGSPERAAGLAADLLAGRRPVAATEAPPTAAKLHGIRGADRGHLAAQGKPVDGLGDSGSQLAMKSRLLTWVVDAAVSLGAVDHGLRLTLDRVFGATMHGLRLIDLPQIRRAVTAAYADLLASEAVALVATRSIQATPGELAVVAPAASAYLRERSSELLELAIELSDEEDVAKLLRDHQTVGALCDTPLRGLRCIAGQRPLLTRSSGDLAESAAATLTAVLPTLRADRLQLVSRSGCSLVNTLPGAVAELESLARAGVVSDQLAGSAAVLRDLVTELHDRWGEEPGSLDLARRYTLCFAAAACLQVWLRNYEDHREDELWTGGVWLEACLVRLLGQLQAEPVGRCETVQIAYGRLMQVMARQWRLDQRLSLIPWLVAGRPGPA
ncbi:acyl-CoA dehydrogenase family protein [Kribbella sp. CA-293567]|uniref:acyl-CoA dehydrogenase family protein n=1 Tax=Kribbella sp. CA-293567 TaxID=3002436 RepID=UPI0022DD1B78|nr:acyl-CoA dehydrogenase family protein [Kribbella sp. CA-293567]WBQ08254.1 hypothetical protein OX958_15935 [Kribbella sp. CA-293567]